MLGNHFQVRAAMSDAGVQDSQVSHVILTHSHFDHAGGIGALLGPGTRVIAQAGFPAELERQHANHVPFGYFTGRGAGFGRGGPESRPPIIQVSQLVSEPAPVRSAVPNLSCTRPLAGRPATR